MPIPAVKKAVATAVDYVIGKSAVRPNAYTVTKFGDGGEPLVTYNVVYNHETGYGRCDCPAATYRGTGSADKHVVLVKNWILAQKKVAS